MIDLWGFLPRTSYAENIRASSKQTGLWQTDCCQHRASHLTWVFCHFVISTVVKSLVQISFHFIVILIVLSVNYACYLPLKYIISFGRLWFSYWVNLALIFIKSVENKILKFIQLMKTLFCFKNRFRITPTFGSCFQDIVQQGTAMASGGEAGDLKMDESGPSSVHKIEESAKQPICIIILGMAGSGKTSLVKRIQTYLHYKQTPPYVVNLDPACAEVPYLTNIGKFFLLFF